MEITYETDLFCLIGDPVEKSLSPVIHNYSFKKNNIDGVYLNFKIEKNCINDFINTVRVLNIKGFNVTIPHKTDILEYLDEIDEKAKKLGAVNTVKNENGKLIGYNTDGIGYLRMLEEERVNVKGSKILIVGAGGAARGIIFSLIEEKPEKILILNRTLSKAENIQNELKLLEEKTTKIEIDTLDNKDLDLNEYELIINCTAIGMYPHVDEVPIEIDRLSKEAVITDIIYKPLETKLLKEAKNRGNKVIGGIGMLINQGLLSEEIWTEKNIDSKEIVNYIKEKIVSN